MLKIVEQHGGFKHGHGRMQSRGLGAGGAHLNNALAGRGNVGVFLAKLAVGENLHFIFAVGKFFQILAKQVHAYGFRFAFRLHTGHFDDSSRPRSGSRAESKPTDQAHGDKKRNKTFHHKSSKFFMFSVNGRTAHQRTHG